MATIKDENILQQVDVPTAEQSPTPVTATATPSQLNQEAPVYSKSQAVMDAEAALNSYNSSKPVDYQSAYSAQIDELLNSVLNRKDFSYDMNADPLYAQYKDQYVSLGQKAMRDTQGQAAGLTGGYGSSYGTVAGQQTYNDYLSRLNDRLPELYGMAQSNYAMQGQQQLQNLAALQNIDASAYGRHRDGMADYYADLSNAMNLYNMHYGQDYNAYQNNLGQWNSDRAYDANRADAALAQENYEREWAYMLEQDAKKSGGSGSGSRAQGTMDINALMEMYDGQLAALNKLLNDMMCILEPTVEDKVTKPKPGFDIANEPINHATFTATSLPKINKPANK